MSAAETTPEADPTPAAVTPPTLVPLGTPPNLGEAGGMCTGDVCSLS